MKKLLNYLKRYYECLYKFDLFRDYFKEPRILALVFILPILVLFVLQFYSASISTPGVVQQSFDPYYDLISNTKYEEVIDFDTEGDQSDWTVKPEDNINIAFIDSKLVLDQSKPLDKVVERDNKSYRVIVDTIKTFDIVLSSENEYAKETTDLLGFNDHDVVVYATEDFVILALNGSIVSYDLTSMTGDFLTTTEIYHYLKANYINPMFIVQLAIGYSVFIITAFYLVVQFLMKSVMKRDNFTISRDRRTRIALYTMQPGLYVYVILAFIMQQSNFAVSFVLPLLASLTMMFYNTKTLQLVKDFVKKEEKSAKRLKKRQEEIQTK